MVVLAFAAVYVIWGTTYLAIRYGIETLPPFLMGSARFFIAGGLLLAWARYRGVPTPRPAHWKPAIIASAFLMVGGMGMVTWAELRIPSGLAAVLISTMPIWMLGLNWARPRGQRPDRKVITGLVVGFVGVIILIGPWQTGGRDVDLLGAAAVLFAALSWATGSLNTRSVRMSVPHQMVTAMQMLSGAVLLLFVGSMLGEWGQVSGARISTVSVAAMVYLALIGSLVALSAYMWLLRVCPPSRVSTYAYVNPVVAVFLGWLVAGESFNLRMLVAAAIILGAVVLVTMGRVTDKRAARPGRVDHPVPGALLAPAEGGFGQDLTSVHHDGLTGDELSSV
jgi:drug/metabolite transporter (DMT)-like permease